MIPGEILVAEGDIEINAGRSTVSLVVANTGDRPIQVGSHYHFYETNPALAFDQLAVELEGRMKLEPVEEVANGFTRLMD